MPPVIPHALDAPRFFDDKPLSAWSVRGGNDGNNGNNRDYRQRAAPKQSFKGASAFQHGRTWPEPEYKGQPIPIEFVRGADGPADDDWTVVVDGLRIDLSKCREDEDGVRVCVLPGGVAREPLTTSTKVRPVTVAIRLEEEAMRPQSATVSLHQLISSTEREEGQDTAKKTLKSVPVEPYRVHHTTANAVVLPYPFWSPSQSALGILEMTKINAYQEAETLAQLWNTIVAARNALNVGYQAKLDEYNNKPPLDKNILPKPKKPLLAGMRFARVKTRNEINDGRFVIGGKKKSIAAELAKRFLLIAGRFEAIRQSAKAEGKKLSLRDEISLIRLDLSLFNDSATNIALFDALLNAGVSAPVQLLMEQLDIARTEDVVNPMSLHIDEFLYNDIERRYIVENCPKAADGDDDEARRFELYPMNVMDTPEDQPVMQLTPRVRHSHDVADTGAPAAAPADGAPSAEPAKDEEFVVKRRPKSSKLEDNAQQESSIPTLLKERYDKIMERYFEAQKAEYEAIVNENSSTTQRSYGEDFMFVYDRMDISRRIETTVQLQIEVMIAYDDDKTFTVRFESEKQDGIVAHAVESKLLWDINDFHVAAKYLVLTIFESHAKKRDSSLSDKWFRFVEGAADQLNMRYRLRRPKRTSDLVNNAFELMFSVSGYALELDEASEKLRKTPYDLDPCNTESRISELRLMMLGLLPRWPPEDPQSLQPTPQMLAAAEAAFSELSKLPAAGAAASASADGAAASGSADGAAASASADSTDSKQKLPEIDATFLKKLLKASNAAETDDKLVTTKKEQNKEDYKQRSTSITNNFDNDSNVLVRKLPQVVAETTWPRALLSKYENDYAKFIVYFPHVEEKKERNTVKIGRWLLTTVFVYVYLILYEQYAEQQKNLKAALDVINIGLIWKRSSGLYPFLLNIASDKLGTLMSQLGFDLSMFGDFRWQEIVAGFKEVVAGGMFAWNVNSIIERYTNSSSRIAKMELQAKLKMQAKLLGSPGNSAVEAANVALGVFYESNASSDKNISLLTVRLNGLRFAFFEYYKGDSNETASVLQQTATNVHKNTEWLRVPDESSLRLFPPVDVTEKLYEVEEMRDIPSKNTLAIAAGTPPKLGGTTPMVLRAKEAFEGLLHLLLHERRIVRGNDLMQTLNSDAFDIVQSAASILKKLYGTKAGATFVGADDFLWSCLRGGVFARLAVRQTGLFDANSSPVDVDTWLKYRHQFMDQFADALMLQASEFARINKPATALMSRRVSILDVGKNAARAFARTHALLDTNNTISNFQKSIALAVLASSIAHEFSTTHNFDTDEMKSNARLIIGNSEYEANRFEDQLAYEMPLPEAYSREAVNAAWASRRVAVHESRNHHVIRAGFPALKLNKIIDTLSGLSVEEPVSCGDDKPDQNTKEAKEEEMLYYCPVGTRVTSFPGNLPFSIDNLGLRNVWFEPLLRAATSIEESRSTAMQQSHRNESPPSHMSINTTLINRHHSRFQGMARHPLVTRQLEETIDVQLCSEVNTESSVLLLREQDNDEAGCPPILPNEYIDNDQGGSGDCLYLNLAYLANTTLGRNSVSVDSKTLRGRCANWFLKKPDSTGDELEIWTQTRMGILSEFNNPDDPQSALFETFNLIKQYYGSRSIKDFRDDEERIQAFVHVHRMKNTWAYEFNIVAAAWVLGVKICTYTRDNKGRLVENGARGAYGPKSSPYTLRLWNKGEGARIGLGDHFAAIRKAQDVVPTTKDVEEEDDDAIPPSSLIEAIEWLQGERRPTTHDKIRQTIKRLRIVAFNAERLLCAMALALANTKYPARIRVTVHEESNVISLMLAIAMLEVEHGRVPMVWLVEENPKTSVLDSCYERARSISERCRLLLERGCRVCSLAEACLCL